MKDLVNRKGFSLVELLVVLGLTGIVISAVYLVYGSGVKAWTRVQKQAEVQQNLRIAMDTLGYEIRSADFISIAPGKREIVLSSHDGTTKAYKFHPASGEIRISGSDAAVSMYIHDCRFGYADNLVTVEITTKSMEDIERIRYIFRINARGKIYDG